MNKKELIETVANRSGISKVETEKLLKNVLDVINETLKKEEPVVLIGFGSFRIWKQNERLGRNPKTGKDVVIPKRLSVKFKPGKFLLEDINEKISQ